MNFLTKYWHRYWLPFLLAVLFVGTEAAADLLQPKLMSLLVDRGALTGSLPTVWKYGLMMLGVAVVGMGSALIRNYISFSVAKGFAADLRLDLFRKIQSLSCSEIDRFEAGSLIVRETNDITQLENFVGDLMRMAIKSPVICIGSIVMAATLSFHTLPIIVPVVILVIGVIVASMVIAYPRFNALQTALDRMNTTVREYLVGIRLVKAFRRLKDEEKRFDGVNTNLTRETIASNRVLLVFTPFLALVVNLGIAAILWFGAAWVDYGDMEVGQIMAFVTYMTSIFSSLTMISNALNGFVRAKASYHRIAAVFRAEPEDATSAGSRRDMPESDGRSDFLSLENVGFRYQGSTGESALCGISFSLKRGERLGIIGPTGSGKTTLAALLLRFYEPSEGTIRINGTPLPELQTQDWRRYVALVPQTPVLFSGTLRDNIAWGREDADEGEILHAAEDAQALEFIRAFPEGLDHAIGQSGGLSGGQKQRLSIARALVRRPELLVLDDCTSALDLVTEAAVREALAEYAMTTIYITQRISTAKACDRILVLENGAMAGFGTHEELMECCPLYQDIYRSQIGGESHGAE
ncbi:MAG: ABC transporter ATP-binding protein [Oscillospiraceae bacterium]|nr:ABC transporter ATP-binding protein [Oscillospiraceae bacterium]